MFEAGTISSSQFAQDLFFASRGYWRHLTSWWEHRGEEEVLLLCYEDMLADTDQAMRTIAAFIGVDLDDDLLDIVVRQSSLAFMSAHERQFDDHLVNDARSAAVGLPPGGDSSKVNDVRAGRPRQTLPPEILKALDQVWQEEIEAKFGLPSYQALREALHAAPKAHAS